MTQVQQKRDWIWVAVIAVGIALLSPATSSQTAATARVRSLAAAMPQASANADLTIGKRVGRSLMALLQSQQNEKDKRSPSSLVFLAVQFVGLVSPLNQPLLLSNPSLNTTAAPLLRTPFSRPPPPKLA